jgi:hypothetical protein
MMLRLREKGAALCGPDLELEGKRIRVVNAASRPLSSAQALYSEMAVPLEQDVVTICAGALDDGGAPPNLMRGGIPATVVRPSAEGQWLTHDQAIAHFSL